jgi:hypothetical protein
MGRNAKSRTDREVAKAIALNLPDVELISHHGTLEIRVGNRTFARFPAEGKSVHLRAKSGWSEESLENLDRDKLQHLMIDAWLLTAPAHLRKIFAERLEKLRPDAPK